MDHFELSKGTSALTAHAGTWNRLAAEAHNPFLSHAWLSSWAESRPDHEFRCATLCDDDGNLRAGALFRKVPLGLASAVNASTDWDAVATDDDARYRLWTNLARLGLPRFHLSGMHSGATATGTAGRALSAAGYGVLPSVREAASPYITLPDSFEELLAKRSANSRRRVRRKVRDLEAAGEVRLYASDGRSDIEHDLSEFLRVEASGWKGREGTAIVSDPATEKLYRTFAHAAAELGWLRLHQLLLDDKVIAASLDITLGEEMFLVKTGFDDAYAELSPGYVLAVKVVAAAIEDGLQGIDMLGRADEFKMSWADSVRPRQRLRVLRGPAGRLAQRGWSSFLHPRLVRLRDQAREDPELGRRLERLQNLVSRSR